MKKIVTLMIAFTMILLVTGCASKPIQPDDSFDEKHAKDMEHKMHEEETTTTGDKISTIDLLTPAMPATITEMTVEYTSWTNWFYAEPENDPTAPAVILIHEWWGLNDHIKDMARILAKNGYKALAVDLYKGQVADNMETAKTFSSSLVQDEATANLLAAEAFLRTKTDKVASLWRCLGGKQSLELSIASETLDATIIYYWRLTGNAEILKNINEPVLWIFAENDSWIPPSAVAEFQQWLETAWKKWFNLTIYSGTNHAFANPTWNAFAKEATLDAWSKVLWFLKTNLE
jgi:carboxymethylenebutenolidase